MGAEETIRKPARVSPSMLGSSLTLEVVSEVSKAELLLRARRAAEAVGSLTRVSAARPLAVAGEMACVAALALEDRRQLC